MTDSRGGVRLYQLPWPPTHRLCLISSRSSGGGPVSCLTGPEGTETDRDQPGRRIINSQGTSNNISPPRLGCRIAFARVQPITGQAGALSDGCLCVRGCAWGQAGMWGPTAGRTNLNVTGVRLGEQAIEMLLSLRSRLLSAASGQQGVTFCSHPRVKWAPSPSTGLKQAGAKLPAPHGSPAPWLGNAGCPGDVSRASPYFAWRDFIVS